jgi:uncharacterized protein YjiS (DUF1127 family)
MLHNLAVHWSRWRLRRHTISRLRALDVHILDDIGIPAERIVDRATRAAEPSR